MEQILLVAGNKSTMNSLRQVIEKHELDCSVASSQRRALYLVRHNPPDVVIMDKTSPRLSGDKLVTGLRRLADVPLITITRTREEAMGMGAEVSLIKPYTGQQLINSIEDVLKKYPRELKAGALSLDLRTREVYVPHLSKNKRLTPKLFALLRLLMQRKGEVVTRAELMRDVWKTEFVEDTRTLDVHIHWIRMIIEPNPAHPTYLTTVRGMGYRFVGDEN